MSLCKNIATSGPRVGLIAFVVAFVIAISSFSQAAEFWDLPPLRYSESVANDPFAKLMSEVEAGRVILPKHDSKAFLLALLKALDVPVESQVLVFSKTSKQVQLISPGNPRAIYFSDNTYVAWVPGGAIEVIAHDPKLGPVFYEIQTSYTGGKVNFHRPGACLACHVHADGEGALGLTLRSAQTMRSGTPTRMVETAVNHQTPYQKRWGGWYVTGGIDGMKHLGNWASDQALNLSKHVPAGRYPYRGSDVVALMVLDHQTHLYSLFTKASMHYRRALWLEEALAKQSSVEPGGENTTSARIAKRLAEEILHYLLFCDEAKMGGDGVEGSEAFQSAFQKNAHRVGERKRSLKDLRLYEHIFKNRCSYMIYSEGFKDLPEGVKSVLKKRLDEVLEGTDTSGRFDHLGERERGRILEILSETVAK